MEYRDRLKEYVLSPGNSKYLAVSYIVNVQHDYHSGNLLLGTKIIIKTSNRILIIILSILKTH